LSGKREPGVRERAEPDLFDRFEPYVRQRLVDDQHVWGTTLFDEVVVLGYDRSYQTFTRKLRERDLGPHCELCSASHGRGHTDIEHPAGAEIQWDWLELDETPWGAKAYVLVGALAHSSRFRAWFSESDDQAHLVVGIDEIPHRLGAPLGGGGWTGWPRSSTRAPAGCSGRLRPSPSITASVSMRARRGTATARVSSRRTSTS
jgi:hypothetical protein